jgi:hypothetical protein
MERKSIMSPAGIFTPELKSTPPKEKNGSAREKKPKKQDGERV